MGQPSDGRLLPISWAGETAQRVGSEIEVLNQSGEVVARTGTGQIYICIESANTPRFWYGCKEEGPDATPPPPPPLMWDLAAVKAKFEEECERPSMLEVKTCEQIVTDSMIGEDDHLFVLTTIGERDAQRVQAVCKEIVAADLNVEPGYEILIVIARNGGIRSSCRSTGELIF